MASTAFAAAGSQRWLQVAIARAPAVLTKALREAGALANTEAPTWTSPLHSDGFQEYRDREALRRIGADPLPKLALSDFWPRGGPVWDALATVGSGAALLVEAKAHIAEAASPGSKASPDSLERIKRALAQARKFYAPRATSDWHLTFFQYANRLALQYLLREVNGFDSRLVFLNFLNAKDVGGPASIEQWEGATRLLHAALGLPPDLHAHGVFHAYVNVAELPRAP